MAQSKFNSRLEIASRLGAFLIVVLYVSGFMVVTFGDASYGIVAFGFLRAKLLSAGILFSIFVVLPLLQTLRAFGLLGFRPLLALGQAEDKPKAVSDYLSRGIKLLDLFVAAWVTVFLIRVTIFKDTDLKWTDVVVLGVFFIVAIFLTKALHKWFPLHAVSCFIASLGTVVAGFVSLVAMKKTEYIVLLLWFLAVGSFAHHMEAWVKEPGRLRDDVNWHVGLVHIIAVFGFFTFFFYPKIKPQFGGGQPVEATFQFAGVSPVDGAPKTKAWLVDEVDGGYYVLRAPNDHKAVFIPKPLISAVYF